MSSPLNVIELNGEIYRLNDKIKTNGIVEYSHTSYNKNKNSEGADIGPYFKYISINTSNYNWALNDVGEIAMTSDLDNYLPLTGGTITGELRLFKQISQGSAITPVKLEFMTSSYSSSTPSNISGDGYDININVKGNSTDTLKQFKFRFLISSCPCIYEKDTSLNSILPCGLLISTAPSLISCSFISKSSNILTAHAKAFCNSVTTPDISLKGLVY